ncbi:MAG: hypothetical protein HONBIEJF_02937 [Fimbriimonadaceae bacterium]|nr:hypothetical protein [Fimbriimonadaceae bacterium]
MDSTRLARMCKALGDPTRVRIFEFLLQCRDCEVGIDDSGSVSPASGPSVGQVCCHITGIDRATSTISFHLKELREAGLIRMEKRGQQMICGIDPDGLKGLAGYFQAAYSGSESCCQGTKK